MSKVYRNEITTKKNDLDQPGLNILYLFYTIRLSNVAFKGQL
jgi:hypothetical protein